MPKADRGYTKSGGPNGKEKARAAKFKKKQATPGQQAIKGVKQVRSYLKAKAEVEKRALTVSCPLNDSGMYARFDGHGSVVVYQRTNTGSTIPPVLDAKELALLVQRAAEQGLKVAQHIKVKR